MVNELKSSATLLTNKIDLRVEPSDTNPILEVRFNGVHLVNLRHDNGQLFVSLIHTAVPVPGVNITPSGYIAVL